MADAPQTVEIGIKTIAVFCVLAGFIGGLLTGLVYHMFNQEITVVTEDEDDDDDDGDTPEQVPDEPVSRTSRRPRFPVESN